MNLLGHTTCSRISPPKQIFTASAEKLLEKIEPAENCQKKNGFYSHHDLPLLAVRSCSQSTRSFRVSEVESLSSVRMVNKFQSAIVSLRSKLRS